MDRHTSRQTYKQIHTHRLGRQPHRRTDRTEVRDTDNHTVRHADRHTDRHPDRQTCTKEDSHKDIVYRQTDKCTYRHMETQIYRRRDMLVAYRQRHRRTDQQKDRHRGGDMVREKQFKEIIFSLYASGESADPFSQFSHLLPLTEVSPQASAIPGGNSPGDWQQSAVGWGETEFETGTAGQQSGTLPLSHHASLKEWTPPVKMKCCLSF
jgi:hypothetical protein